LLEARVELSEKEVYNTSKSEKRIKTKWAAEIRTQDLRRLNILETRDVTAPANVTRNDYAMDNQMQCTGLQHFWKDNEAAFRNWLYHRDISKPTKQTYFYALVGFFFGLGSCSKGLILFQNSLQIS
jgi:hypothetical protein